MLAQIVSWPPETVLVRVSAQPLERRTKPDRAGASSQAGDGRICGALSILRTSSRVTEYLRDVRTIYSFTPHDAHDEAMDALRAVMTCIQRETARLVYADGEGWSNQDGYRPRWIHARFRRPTAFPHCASGAPLKVDGKDAEYFGQGALQAMADVAGLPALVGSAGQDEDGLPIGVQIVGPRWSEISRSRPPGPRRCARRSGAPPCGPPAEPLPRRRAYRRASALASAPASAARARTHPSGATGSPSSRPSAS
ncbi:amidase family protein [Sorangium sp. So ce185]|uniref:amidase family protein n=1 Tax=Sorangium sp. So ce185 TaxID=3133287 RepID=UPI003F6015D5